MTTYAPDFSIRTAVRKVLPYMMEMREYFHARPELSGKEFDTCKTIFRELTLTGVADIKIIAGTGITGIIHGALPGPTVLVRAATDALPLEETDDSPYASIFPGVMHAAGHDGHTATLLGLAKLLTTHADCLRGNVRLAFEPESETRGGAEKMIDSAVLTNPPVDYALNIQIDGTLAGGEIGFCSGTIFASRDDFTITVNGTGGHCTQVAQQDDAIRKGLSLIGKISDYVATLQKQNTAALISFGRFNGGNTTAVIPDRVEIKGTLRTFDDDIRRDILAELEELCRTDCTWEHCFVAPVGKNDTAITAACEEIWQTYCADRFTVIKTSPDFRSDDFARFGEHMPIFSCFVGIHEGIPLRPYSSSFIWDSSMLKYTCEATAALIYYLPSYGRNL